MYLALTLSCTYQSLVIHQSFQTPRNVLKSHHEYMQNELTQRSAHPAASVTCYLEPLCHPTIAPLIQLICVLYDCLYIHSPVAFQIT